MTLTLKKGEAVKYVSPESSLLEKLKFEGWVVEGEAVEVEAPRRGRPPKKAEE